MSSLPIGESPPFQPHRFLPAVNLNVSDWSQIALLFDRLESRAPQCATAADLESWLFDWSELGTALGEEWARRNIAMTCHTDDAQAKRAYLDFVEQVLAQVETRQFRLAQLFRSHPLRPALPVRTYEVFDRATAASVELYRADNVALETEEAKLVQHYDEITGAMSVQFLGGERTLQEMWKFLQEPNRFTRQEAWEVSYNRALADADNLDSLFESMLQCRVRMAANSGFKNYRDYAWRRLRRFDYTPDQCAAFHLAIESEILPVVCELQKQRTKKLGVNELRPWDTEVDPAGGSPLRPFVGIPELVAGTQRIFDRIDNELASGFQQLRDSQLLDLENRKNKAPGGYQVLLSESRLPFIFLNTVGVHMDVVTLLHEGGHAFHSLEARAQPLLAYRSAPIEFCEVASISMELIGSEFLAEFYSPADVQRARRSYFEAMLASFPWLATLDAFQHWVYTNPGHTRTERADAWLALMKRFGGLVDWTGYERVQTNLWHDVGHVFQSPFYFVEYGIACLGALQIWSNWKKDRNRAMAAYKRGLALGGSRPLPELFAAADCKFEFSAEAIRPLIQLIRDELQRLSA
jgi:oligoendopeptidase F